MNDIESARRRLFWMLKKWSSYSVWAMYAERFDEFVRQYEIAVSDWPEGEALPEENLLSAYAAQTDFARGLSMLKVGDRACWRVRDDGHLLQAAGEVFRATKGVTSYEINKYQGGEWGLPLYADWTARLETLRLLKIWASPEGVVLVGERQSAYAHQRATAVVGESAAVTDWLNQNISRFGSIPAEGEAVPTPSAIMLKSGDLVPCDGVWELFRPGITPGKTDLLNYFLAGTKAPWQSDGSGNPGATAPAIWRLVWEDTRYRDGVIPDESEYLADYAPAVNEPATHLPPVDHPTRAEANQPCPNTGYWYTPAKAHSRALFKRGEVMPDFPGSSYGATIWYWDMNQTSQ